MHERIVRGAARIGRATRRQVALLPLLGLIPSFLLATYSLTLPWASGRAFALVRISRSPGAAMLLAVTLAGMVAASVTVATRTNRRDIAAAVHLLTGAVMCVVAGAAFRMIRGASVSFLGLFDLASVKPGPGLKMFMLASVLVVVLGLFEMWLAVRRRRR
ncbi:MAG: hypothetical protein Q7W56_13475 [Candidatus Latescibacteria bacterium]|nr:hypothetical protein [Candidatus Latescibacterota bacterium]